ncbi:hypothetical protein [Streptomyces eurocidicus]|uniref:Uncharacterized protein n=1 Tax=Streptomyces eurocidicus TaxID=66423 RepID=A0A7W8B4W0_STREU|nr:hypothetical protein [Streptomyces eurocidicus]MBB5116850.1 hypothetical protein [Streptomyces eurocidicus]
MTGSDPQQMHEDPVKYAVVPGPFDHAEGVDIEKDQHLASPQPLSRFAVRCRARGPASGMQHSPTQDTAGRSTTPRRTYARSFWRIASFISAKNGLLVVIAVKERASGAVAAAQATSLDGGGWTWVAPDGKATATGDGNGSAIVNGGGHGNELEAGTYDETRVAFDIPESARGGMLMFKDSNSHLFKWQMPAKDAGPQIAKFSEEAHKLVS